MRNFWKFIWSSGKEEAFWTAFSWLAEWFNWRSVASGVILSSVAAILAWPKIEPWQLVLLIAFSMGIGVWAANGFLLLWDKMYTANTHVHSMDNKSPPLSTSAASNQLANNVSEKKASDLKAASISIKAHLGFRAQSIECSFKNMTLHGMTECVYFVTNLQQWSPEHADYFRETEEFVPFAIKGPPKLESGVEPQKINLLSRLRKAIHIDGTRDGQYMPYSKNVRDGSMWKLTLTVSS